MNDWRRFRLLVPPFFFGLSLVVALYFSGFRFGNLLQAHSTELLIAFGAVIGALILPIGIFITSVSILVLYAISWAMWRQTYEAALPSETWDRIWTMLSTEKKQHARWYLYAAATFDHELLSRGVHDWIQRRWSTFNISIHSFMAILLSHFAALLPSVRETWQWLLLSAVLLIVFGLTAGIAWIQTMRMLEFQASRQTAVLASAVDRLREMTSNEVTNDEDVSA